MNCITDVSIPTLIVEPCDNNYLSTDCVLIPEANVTLDLPANSKQTEVNDAITAALIYKEQQIEGIEAIVLTSTTTNATTTVLSSATLTSTYPTATIGFKVHALSIIAGGRIYEKTSTGWCEYLATVTA